MQFFYTPLSAWEYSKMKLKCLRATELSFDLKWVATRVNTPQPILSIKS